MIAEKQEGATEYEKDEITESIIGCAYAVSNSLGSGFLEKVYENALAHELRKHGHTVEQQNPVNVYYDGVLVGEYVADMLVDGYALVELKTTRVLTDVHVAQCINYLRATGRKVCLLMNFGAPKVEVRRLSN